jgi:hypothetical protein
LVACLALAWASSAFAQGAATTSTISGVVVDSAGGVVPGAEVTIKHLATGVTQSGTSNAEGAYSFPSLPIGTYSVTVALQGFKTFVTNDVVITAGSPASVRAVLEVGGLEEQVLVSSRSEIVQTQSTVISSTINSQQIMKLPNTSRAALDFVTSLPGVTSPGGNRQSQINGLPRGVINITLDGVNVQDNTLRSTDGFFAIVNPRLDAVEEITVTTATQEASAGQGAVQIKFVTRSGGNQFTGSGYYYYRTDKLNANTWLNNRAEIDKTRLRQKQMGVRTGGPIVIPGLFDGRNKAFFFVNYEEVPSPGGVSRDRNILTPLAQQGVFTYIPTGGSPQTVNLLALAQANGVTSTPDPIVANLLRDIRSSTSSGSVQPIDANLERLRYNSNFDSVVRYPTTRVDYNITDKHRFSNSFNYQRFNTNPDTLNNRDAQFPGFPAAASQTSERYAVSNSLRSTVSSNIVNEVLVAWSGAPVNFFKEFNTDMWGGTSVADQGGYRILFPTTTGMNPANASGAATPQSRNASTLLIEDTFTWLRGKHSLSMGGSWTQYDLWLKNQQLVANLSLGATGGGLPNLVTGDPALAMFNATNFPGASSDQLNQAQALYAILTGRVTQLASNAALGEDSGQYEYLGLSTQRARMREGGFFVQDSWRIRPDVTINAGLRYELQFPFTPRNNSYSTATVEGFCGRSGTNPDTFCNLFQAGNQPGAPTTFINFGEGTPAYSTDYDNWAPSVGVAWTLKGGSGLTGTVFGRNDGDSVFRAGFTRSFSREGMANFSNQFGANPGVTLVTDRNQGRGNLAGTPLLFRDGNLGPAAFPATPQYPLTDAVTEDVNLMDPNLQVPYADSWTVGLQRAIGRNMAVEVRYVGTRGRELWETLNYNEINIFDNGFIQEFRAAQANLRANVAAGLASQGFAYRGAGTGTVPLPIMFAYFQGAGDPNNSAAYTSANFRTNNNFLTPLATYNPNPFTFATNLYNNATQRTNAANSGRIPANFFLMNPDLIGGADLTTNTSRSNYHALQLELRRRLANGLQFNANYAYGNQQISSWQTHRRDIYMIRDAGDPGDLTHVFKVNALYDLPFGQGRRFGGNVNGLVNRIIGDWSVSLVGRLQSGRLIDLGNVRLVGMTEADVRGFFKLRFDDAAKKIWMLPQDVIDNTIRAFNVSATHPSGYAGGNVPTGRYFAPANGPDCIEIDNGADYGDCGARSLVVTGPTFHNYDISIAKRIPVVGRTNLEFRFEMLNALNNHNFIPVGGIGSVLNDYEVTQLTGNNQARVIQFVTRFNW